MNIYRAAAIMGLAMIFVGCANVRSNIQSNDAPRQSKGLVYHLPRRSVNITITFSDKSPTIDIAEGTSYPDLSNTFFANIPRSLTGKINSTVTVSPSGLLSTTTAAYTGQIKELAKSWAGTSTEFLDLHLINEHISDAPCPNSGSIVLSVVLSHVGAGIAPPTQPWSISPDGAGSAIPTFGSCGDVSVSIKRLGWQKSDPDTPKTLPRRIPGYYYRANAPYMVDVTFRDARRESLVMLPDESPTYFIDLPRAVFADTSNTTTFTDGVLTTHTQSTDSEVISALEVPADLIRAYMSAAGSFFDSFKARDTKQAAYEKQLVLDELARQKLADCRAAIAANDKAKMDALCPTQ